MGMYATVRGWVQIDPRQRPAAEEIIRRDRPGLISPEQQSLYAGGWAFPARPFNWTLCLFYGGDIRELLLDWMRAQVADLAALPPADEDSDRPVGVFVVTDERRHAWTWEIRGGTVTERPAPKLAWLND